MYQQFPSINEGVISATDCIREGKDLIIDRYWLMVGICLVGYWLASMAPFYILYGPMMCGIAYCLMALLRNQPLEFADLFKGFNYFGPAFLAGLIQMAPVFVVMVVFYAAWFGAIIMLGPSEGAGADEAFPLIYGSIYAMWFVIMIVIAITNLICAFCFPLIIEWKLNGWDAVRVSAQAVRANLGGAIGLLLLCALINLGGAMLCGFGFYLTFPITQAAWVVAYRQVFPEPPDLNNLPPDPPKWREWRPDASA